MTTGHMQRVTILSALLLQAAVAAGPAPEPVVGTWRLERQELDGQTGNIEPMTLRITQEGDKLAFAFSVPVNKVYFVSMSYTVRPDGSESDVKNSQGESVGTVRITKAGRLQYKMLLKGPNRPDTSGTLVVSGDGKTLTSETDTAAAGRSRHLLQVFSRY